MPTVTDPIKNQISIMLYQSIVSTRDVSVQFQSQLEPRPNPPISADCFIDSRFNCGMNSSPSIRRIWRNNYDRSFEIADGINSNRLEMISIRLSLCWRRPLDAISEQLIQFNSFCVCVCVCVVMFVFQVEFSLKEILKLPWLNLL